jgi:hypothetical protein
MNMNANMNALANDILGVLEKQTAPISVHDIIVALPNYEVYNIKTELWDLSANGLVKFDWNWKITRSNDGPASF